MRYMRRKMTIMSPNWHTMVTATPLMHANQGLLRFLRLKMTVLPMVSRARNEIAKAINRGDRGVISGAR